MPPLTLRGFIDSTAMELLTNPSQGWTYLNRALHYYQIPLALQEKNRDLD
jgi:hypothetical protein